MIIEELINEYWMYPNESFYIIRFTENSHTYLYGKSNHNSAGVIKKREMRNWLEPTETQITEVNKQLSNRK